MISGWQYRGDFIPAADGDGADITVIRSRVPPADEEAEPGHPVWRTLAGGRTLLSLPGIGRFLIAGGNRVEVEPAEDADPVTLGLLLDGAVLAVLLRQRGLLPFDGSAVGRDGGALLIVGASGLGKSSLAARFALDGWSVLADGVLGVGQSAADRPELVRGAPRLRLWQRSAQALGLDLAGCAPLRPGVPRFDTVWGDPAGGSGPSGPWPVTGVAIVLNRADAPSCERLPPGRAVACLTRCLWSRPAFGEDPARAAALMADLIALTSAVPCWLLTMGEGLETLGATAAALASEM